MRNFYKVAMVLGSAFFISNALGAEFSKDQICKGAISVEMYQDVGIMTTVKTGDVPQVTYVRKMDGDRFLYRCKFSGDRVIWSPFFGDNQSWGRWRDGEYDAVLTYKVTDGRLSIHSTETNMTKFFEKREFK